MKRSILLAAAVVLGACGILDLDDGTVRTFEVAPFKGSCFGLFPTLCLQVREPGAADWGNLYDTPAGFDFEWGVATVIEVEERTVDPAPVDGSSIRRTLRRVLSRTPEPADATFELFVLATGLEAVGGGRYRVYSGPDVVACDGGATCAGLDSRCTRSAPSSTRWGTRA